MSGRTPAPPSRRWALLARRAMDGLVGATLGGAVYGGWTTAVNWSTSPALALRAGALHFVMSFGLTLGGTAWMRWVFGRARLGRLPARAASALACVAGLALTYALLLTVHMVNGTPHIALSLAPGVLPNVVFCATYALLLLGAAPIVMQPPVAATPRAALTGRP